MRLKYSIVISRSFRVQNSFSLEPRLRSSSATYSLTTLLCNLCFSSLFSRGHLKRLEEAWTATDKILSRRESVGWHLKLSSHFPSFLCFTRSFTRAVKCSRKVYKILRPWPWNLHSCSNCWIVRLPFKFLFLESFPLVFVQHSNWSVCGSFDSRRSSVQHRENKFPLVIQ